MTGQHSTGRRQSKALPIDWSVEAPRFGSGVPLLATIAVTLAVLSPVANRPALAGGDAALGEKVFNQCKTCHTLVDGKNAIGPSLLGVVGRKAGTATSFKYSDAMVKAGEGGLTWDAAALDEYLKDPKAKLPGNKMTFLGLKSEQDRENVISYLKSKTQ